MRAVHLNWGAAQSVLELVERAEPEVGDGQVLLRVHASSVNRADVLQRQGAHSPRPASGVTPAGLDAAGEVLTVGQGVEGVEPGDRVMALAAGGLAEFVVVDASMVVPLPPTWTYVEGAAAIIGLLTEHNALKTSARLRTGESVLVHGASSGVGLQCVQMAKFFGAGPIIATTRSTKAHELLLGLGADEVVDTTRQDFVAGARALTDGRGVDVIIDHVGGPHLAGSVAAAAVRGRLIGVGRLGGAQGELDMEALALKRLEIIGVTFRTRSAQEKAAVVAALRSDVDADAYEHLRPHVARVLPWTEVNTAYDIMESNSHLGKLVLEVVRPGGAM